MAWPPRSGKIQNFPEIDRVAYFSVTQARRKILPGQCAFIDDLIRHLKAGGKSSST
jgi:predicted NUDIX family NTP pyrophosphohydrolase